MTCAAFNDRMLEYTAFRKLGLTVPDHVFRKNICEFVCTYYKAYKQDVTWNGPLSKLERPRGWTTTHEMEWMEYLQYHHFPSEFWTNFWNALPEGIWETRTPRWREALQQVVLHYIRVNPAAIDYSEDGSDNDEVAYED